MITRISLILSAIVFSTSATPAAFSALVNIGFDDGAGNGVLIEDFYASLGADFQKAVWFQDTTPLAPRPGSTPPFEIRHADTGSQPKSTDPIVILFSHPVSMVTITAIDVGFNDAQMDAYDSVAGGILLDSSTYEGVTALGNEGDANDTGILTVAGGAIQRVELFQPFSVQANDGLSFDNLSFLPIPEPSSVICVSCFVALCCRRRQQ